MPRKGAVIVDEDVGRLSGDTEGFPDLAARVGDVLESVEAEVIDERCDGFLAVLAGDADEADVLPELLLRLCDRRCDSLAVWSPRSPEPEDGVLGQDVSEVHLTAGNCLDHRCCRGRCLRGRRLRCRARNCLIGAVSSASGNGQSPGNQHGKGASTVG